MIGKGIGTIADENGSFILRLGKNTVSEKNPAVISSIGYESILLRIPKVKNSILLNRESKALIDSITKLNDFELKKIGRMVEKGIVSISFHNKRDKNIDDKLGREIGTILNLRGRSYLTKVYFFIDRNKFDKVKFRLNIYNVKNKYPKDLIVNEEILIELNQNQTGWIEVNVSK